MEAGGLRLFLDRSTNSKRFAQAVRERVPDVVTIGERYGVKAAEGIQDVQWIAEATAERRICVGADSAMLGKNELELAAILEHSARYLVFSHNNLTSRELIERFHALLPQIQPLAEVKGPWVYKLTADRLSEVPERVLRQRLEARRRRSS